MQERDGGSEFCSLSRGDNSGQFRKKGGFGERALVPVFAPGEHVNVPSFRFAFWGNIRQCTLVPGFRSEGTSTKTTLLENPPFGEPPILAI